MLGRVRQFRPRTSIVRRRRGSSPSESSAKAPLKGAFWLSVRVGLRFLECAAGMEPFMEPSDRKRRSWGAVLDEQVRPRCHDPAMAAGNVSASLSVRSSSTKTSARARSIASRADAHRGRSRTRASAPQLAGAAIEVGPRPRTAVYGEARSSSARRSAGTARKSAMMPAASMSPAPIR